MSRTAARTGTLHRRVLGWLHHDDVIAPSASDAPPGTHRDALRHQLYRDIGEFLFTHELEPSPRNFTVAHGYLSNDDPELARAVTWHLHTGDPLSDERIEQIVEQQNASALTPQRLSTLATQLEAQLADCVSAVDTTRSSTVTFGSALNEEAANLSSDPAGTLQRVIALTRGAVEATRLAELQLQQTRREADTLRSDLEQARRAAEQDHLTGLPNRRCFEARLATIMARGDARDVTVALCDIDDFKQVNDRHGHPAGDRVLRFVSDFLRTQLGSKALVARFGGEEFACLFEDAGPQHAHAALDAVRRKLSGRSLMNQENGLPIGTVTFSAGVAPIVARDVRAAMQAADAALYTAKRDGKDAVVIAPA